MLFNANAPLQELSSPCAGYEVGKLYLDDRRFICVIRQPATQECGQISYVQFIMAQRANRLSGGICEDFAHRHPLCDALKGTFTVSDLDKTQIYMQADA